MRFPLRGVGALWARFGLLVQWLKRHDRRGYNPEKSASFFAHYEAWL